MYETAFFFGNKVVELSGVEFTISIGEEEAYLRVSLSKLRLRERKGFFSFLLDLLLYPACGHMRAALAISM